MTTIRLIKHNGKIVLKNKSVAIKLAQTGRRGPLGATGPQGQKGDNGQQGPIGATGTQGHPGATGPTGPSGLTGSTGPQGATGPQGVQGATGMTGPQGPIGATGPQGDPATNLVSSVAGKTGAVTLDKSDVGLGNVDNTSDADKIISTATQTALDGKANFPDTDSHVPVRDGTGAQSSLRYTSGTTGYTIGFRTADGQIGVGAPTDNTHATTKAYVDTADALKVNKAGDNMTARLGNSYSNMSISNTRGGKEIIFGASSIGHFAAMDLTNNIEFVNIMSDGSGIRFGNSNARGLIYGTGFPNGVVSAVVGSTYIDTNATNGAIEWKKATGSGNTGWVVSVGDTGWRDVNSIVAGCIMRVRRIGSVAYCRIYGSITATGTVDLGSKPIGFRPSVFSPGYYFQGGSVPLKLMDDGGGIVLYSAASGAISSAVSSGATSDPWPTTLPGTAV